MVIPYPLNSSIDNPLISNSDSSDIFKNTPFWLWNQEVLSEKYRRTVGKCCFNHLIGLPIKNNKDYDIFLFQKLIFDAGEYEITDPELVEEMRRGLTIVRYHEEEVEVTKSTWISKIRARFWS